MKISFDSIIVIVFLLSFVSKSFSQDVLLQYDMLPIGNKNSLYETSIKSNDLGGLLSNSFSESSINSLIPQKMNNYNFGFVENYRIKKTFDLSYSEASFRRNGIPKDLEIEDIMFKYKFLNILGGREEDWKINIGFRHQSIFNSKFRCYEGLNYLVSKISYNCIHKTKPIFYTKHDQNALEMTSNLNALEFSIRKNKSYWGIKNTYEFGVKSNLINYDILFNDVFSENNLTYIETFPQTTPWISHNIYSSIRQARKLNKNWALGGSITINKIIRQNFKKSIDDASTNDNIIVHLSVNRKIGDYFYFGLIGSHSKNYLIGLEPIQYTRGNTNIFDESINSLSMKIGYISNNQFKEQIYEKKSLAELYTKNIHFVKNKKRSKNNKDIKKNKKIKTIQRDKENEKEMFLYALKFAYNYDLSLKSFLN